MTVCTFHLNWSLTRSPRLAYTESCTPVWTSTEGPKFMEIFQTPLLWYCRPSSALHLYWGATSNLAFAHWEEGRRSVLFPWSVNVTTLTCPHPRSQFLGFSESAYLDLIPNFTRTHLTLILGGLYIYFSQKEKIEVKWPNVMKDVHCGTFSHSKEMWENLIQLLFFL